MDDYTIKSVIHEFYDCADNMQQKADIYEILDTKQLFLIRSAKIEVLEKFLDFLLKNQYNGTIHLLGRNEDFDCINQYSELDIRAFIVNEQEQYTYENTKNYIEGINADTVAFLFQRNISDNHINLLEIVANMNCRGYGISRDLEAVRLVEAGKYLAGRKLYIALCEWFYLMRK